MHTFMGDTPIVTLILVCKAHHYSAHLPYRCVKHTYILKGVQNTPLWVAHQWCAVALVCIAHPDFTANVDEVPPIALLINVDWFQPYNMLHILSELYI